MYSLQALIADKSVLDAAAPPGLTIVSLPQRKALIPLSDSVLQCYGIPFLPFTYDGLESVPSELIDFATPFVRHGRVAYIEACCSGGEGVQACIVWEHNGPPSSLMVDACAINHALQFLDVKVGNECDEFDALDLGCHRKTDDWESRRGCS
jgi:hypothetical protein